VIGHDRVSTLRLRHLFPAEVLDHARFYVEVPDEEGPGNFAESYRGGSWRSEVIDGVSFWYPKLSRRQVGIMQISGGPMVQGSPEPFTGPLVDAGWAKNANAVLKTLEINLHIGDALASVHAHAAGQVRVTRLTDGARQFVSLSCRAPDVYHLHGIVHDRAGLILLEIRRPDLIRKNEFEKGCYDQFDGVMFDEELEI
jgi:hypothetical protein